MSRKERMGGRGGKDTKVLFFFFLSWRMWSKGWSIASKDVYVKDTLNWQRWEVKKKNGSVREIEMRWWKEGNVKEVLKGGKGDKGRTLFFFFFSLLFFKNLIMFSRNRYSIEKCKLFHVSNIQNLKRYSSTTLGSRQFHMGSLAGAARMWKDSACVQRATQKEQKSFVE